MHILFKNEMAWRIKVTFAGSLPPKEYVTPDIRNTDPGWSSELFNRVIEKLEFYLPTGHRIVLSGMERYNFFIDALQSFGGGGKGRAVMKTICFLGKLPGLNTVDRFLIGDKKIWRDRKPWGKEWHGSNTTGWKFGLPGTVISSIVGG